MNLSFLNLLFLIRTQHTEYIYEQNFRFEPCLSYNLSGGLCDIFPPGLQPDWGKGKLNMKVYSRSEAVITRGEAVIKYSHYYYYYF